MIKSVLPPVCSARVPTTTLLALLLYAVTAFSEPPNTDPKADGWTPLFDGKSLAGWKVSDFGGHGDVEVKDGKIIINMGEELSGISYTKEVPKDNYEVSLEAMLVLGGDFFCGLTLPAGGDHCTLILGGWGGGVVGISSIDGMDASENETTSYRKFDPEKWYAVRVRVTPEKIEAWIDKDKIADATIKGRKVSMRPGEIELSVPFGLATFRTTGAVRDIKIRKLGDGVAKAPAAGSK